MKHIGNWLKDPLVSFFTLCLALMYLLMFPAVFLMGSTDHPLLQTLVLYAGRLSVYGPVLVALRLTRRESPEQSPAPAWRRRASFLVVLAAAAVIYALDLRRMMTDDALGWGPLLILSIPAALLPAYVVSRSFSRITSLRDYLSTLLRPRGNVLWYLVALFTFPAVQFLGIVITQLLGGEAQLSAIRMSPEILLATLLTFASVFFHSGGINEEGGWRGFAQRRLQAAYCPLTANLILWVYLVLWQIPNDIIQYSDGGYLLIRIGLYPFITILFGWVYNRTRGSLLAPALFHASMNSMNTLQAALPGTNAGYALLVFFAIAAVLMDRMWEKLPADHPAVVRVQRSVVERDTAGL